MSGVQGGHGCSIIRASLPFANIGVPRAVRAQPLYLLTPAGRFALRATAHRADASLRRTHGFAAPLRVALRCAQQPTGLALPFGVPKPVPQHNLASVASGQRPQETRLIPPASFFHQPSGATGASSPLRPIFLLRFGRVCPPARRNQQSNPTSKGANPHDHH